MNGRHPLAVPVDRDGDLLRGTDWAIAERLAIADLLTICPNLEAKQAREIVHTAMVRAAKLARGQTVGV